MNLCALGVNQGLAQMEASGQHYESNSQMKFNTGDSSYSISVDNGSAVCGTVKLPQKPTGWTSVFSSGYADSVYAVQQQATDSLWSKMKNTAEQFNSAYMSKMRSEMGSCLTLKLQFRQQQEITNNKYSKLQTMLPEAMICSRKWSRI